MQSIYSRRRLFGILGGTALVTAGAFSINRPGVDPVAAMTFISGTPEPMDPDSQVLLRVHYEGGFVPTEYQLTNIPIFSLYADGRAITTGPTIEIYPQPALPNLRHLKLTQAGIARVLDEARAAGLADGPKHYDSSAVTDVQTTVFTYNDGPISNVVSAYALGFDEKLVAKPEDLEARAQLIALQSFLGDLSGQLSPEEIEVDDEPYEIEQIRIYSRLFNTSNQDQELVQEPMDWPLSTPLAQFGDPIGNGPLAESTRCGAIAGQDAKTLVAALAKANQLTPWESEGVSYQLWARPLLPDESGCPQS